jgi:predicted nucleotidyltransferase
MQQSLASLLFPAYRRNVLHLLLFGTDEALHGREIARRTGLPSGPVARELNLLANAGLLLRRKQGNQALYTVNRACPIFEEIAGILRKTSGLADVLSEALAPLSKRIDVAFIFGSFARGKESVGSDVDVMIIGPVDFGAVIDALHPAQERLGREINPKVFSRKEWNAKLAAKNAFIMSVLDKPKIFLIGDRDGLEEPDRRKS